MKLKLNRPLVVFDIEATGINLTRDRIVEIAYIKLFPDGMKQSNTLRVNPGISIPSEATAIHGISDEDVEHCPTLKGFEEELLAVFSEADLCGFNSDHFDIPMLVEECIRHEIPLDLSKAKSIDVQNIFHKMEQRTLSAALQFYCDESLDNAHSAGADTEATLKVLEAQLERYEETLSNDVKDLSAFSRRNNNVDYAGRMVYNNDGVEIFNFGKYRGQIVSEVLKKDPAFYTWMMQGDFTQQTKQMLTKIRLRELNTKHA